MVCWSRVDRKTLEQAKLDKLLSKLVKKGDEKVRNLAQKVLDNSGINPNKQLPDGKQAINDSTLVSEASLNLKRPRADEPSSGLPNKKQSSSDNAVTTSTKSIPKPVTALEKRRQLAAKADSKTGAKSASSAPLPEKVKTNHIAAKPSSIFSSLQSASKKSGSAKSALPLGKGKEGREASAPDTKGTAATSSIPKPAFSFAETMANLSRQKSDAPLKSEETKPPETAEAKDKRLRKEQRSKMRVSFKPDDELEEIRLFVHDPEEELGHDDSMVRDVGNSRGNSRGEGEMLKMHRDQYPDEDEEDYEPTEELPAVWHEPSCKYKPTSPYHTADSP